MAQLIIPSDLSYLKKEDLDFIKKAYIFIEKTTKGDDFRYLVSIFQKLAQLKLDKTTLVASLLQNCNLDNPKMVSLIEENFGKEVLSLIKKVKKLNELKFSFAGPKKERRDVELEILRKMLIVLAADLRVVFIKLIDQWEDLENLSRFSANKQVKIAKESLEIYAPIADRLGMGQLKRNMEDLAFPYAYPKEYEYFLKLIKPKLGVNQRYLEQVKKILISDLNKHRLNPIIEGRVKNYFSLYKKLKRYNFDMERVYDLIALRIIVNTIAECYQVLGIIHQRWKPIVGRLKDYITVPKPNGYRSLHTTVSCLNNEFVEFQIRTKEMHQEAEYGIAAHWYYKESGEKNTDLKIFQYHYAWIKELISWQKKIKGSNDFWKIVQKSGFHDRVFAFTPKGEVIDLPKGATVIDFAYYLHSDLGNHAVGAKVNGKITNFSYQIKNGDMVEILVAPKAKPSLDWLSIAKTHKAKEKIKSWLNKYNLA